MKKIMLLLLIIGVFKNSYAQKQNCGWFGTMNYTQRLKQFPFNKAVRIILVSYPAPIDMQANNSAKPLYLKILKVRLEDTDAVYNITKEKEIKGKDVEELSNLLIN